MLTTILLCTPLFWLGWKALELYLTSSPLDNVAGPPRASWLTGNLEQFFDLYDWQYIDEICDTYGPVVKVQGAFGDKFLSFLYVFDTKAVQEIVKHGDVYEESSVFLSLVSTVLGPGLAATTGHVHRRQRKMLLPSFSHTRLREMTPIMYGVAHKLRDAIAAKVGQGPTETDMVYWMGRAALEIIGQAGLGYSFDPLTEDSHDLLGATVKKMFPAIYSLTFSRLLLPYLLKIGSPKMRSWIAERFPSRRLQHLRGLKSTLHAEMGKLFYAKKAAIEKGDEVILQDVGEGKDILSILLRSNMHASETDRQTDEEVIAHMANISFAAIDTSSTLLVIILQLLAQRPDVQSKLRHEIIESRQGGDLTFDELTSLPYLHGVYCESLRLYPGAMNIFRDVQSDTVMPLSTPITGKDGNMISEIFLPAGSAICVALRACNTNREIWGEDAYEWKPERWLTPLPDTVINADMPGILPNLMSFLGGARGCIGYRFAELETKTIISVLLESFSFSLTGADIHWCKADVRFPTMKKELKPKPCMFLNVEPVPQSKF